MTRLSAMGDLAALLDRLDAAGRFALLKLATGAMRIGISSRLAKAAFAQAFSVSIDDVEEYWHGQMPPYRPLFGWAAEGGPPPHAGHQQLFRPLLPPLPPDDTANDLADHDAERK